MTGTLNATWEGDQWSKAGGATWLGGTYDRKPTPSSWAPATRRRGTRGRARATTCTASTLAINPDNGEIKWHLQTTPHDGWDFDGVNEFIPFRPERLQGGQGAKADRNGFFFVATAPAATCRRLPVRVLDHRAKGFDLKTKKPIVNPQRPPGHRRPCPAG